MRFAGFSGRCSGRFAGSPVSGECVCGYPRCLWTSLWSRWRRLRPVRAGWGMPVFVAVSFLTGYCSPGENGDGLCPEGEAGRYRGSAGATGGGFRRVPGSLPDGGNRVRYRPYCSPVRAMACFRNPVFAETGVPGRETGDKECQPVIPENFWPRRLPERGKWQRSGKISAFFPVCFRFFRSEAG